MPIWKVYPILLVGNSKPLAGGLGGVDYPSQLLPIFLRAGVGWDRRVH